MAVAMEMVLVRVIVNMKVKIVLNDVVRMAVMDMEPVIQLNLLVIV
tara:strand:- start:239 stop:376 length:138 start_codon:yes stop_codon:yes gene_type:complete